MRLLAIFRFCTIKYRRIDTEKIPPEIPAHIEPYITTGRGIGMLVSNLSIIPSMTKLGTMPPTRKETINISLMNNHHLLQMASNEFLCNSFRNCRSFSERKSCFISCSSCSGRSLRPRVLERSGPVHQFQS